MAEVVGCCSEVITAATKIKWVKIYGTKYLQDECYVVMAKDGEDLPQFAKIVAMFYVNHSLICFEVSQLKTQHFNKNLNAYHVTLPSTNDPLNRYILQKVLLIPDALQTFTLQAKIYINVRHDIGDM